MVEMKYVENNSIKLPNNIRQVGTPGDKLKIYIEDYVMTYLNQVAGEKAFGQKAAILLGERKCKAGMDIYFISAAIRIEDTEITEDALRITSDMWTVIYEQIEQYFKEKHILGWFLTRSGRSVEMNGQIERIQLEQFGDKGKLFYSVDPSDQEEAFYFYENGHLIRQQGYYIYYERNEAMQNYMIERRQNGDIQDQEASGFQERLTEKKVDIRSRKENYKKHRKHQTKWVYQAATILLIFTVLIAVRRNISRQSVAVIQSVDRQRQYETASYRQTNSEIIYNETEQEESIIIETETESEIQETYQEETVDEATFNHVELTYTVKQGDTLVAISRKFYQDLAHVEEIIQLNQIEDPDYIYPGMVLNMP